ncbi:acyl-CoA dehydratase activase [Acetobacterium woodii]|uniref:2-hydroxyglutaryl-CoA dehydratase alpha subunit HgdC n=1 Tax=Acetobacterium woodii (strain ATCC 29683 / DSM 1030 / JCM 2381 / KCTC 1655 / WB1) TaxID=931626 RepID=H6LB67_ACEWD|nr:acyl-CoA dehydratase activase [Acetobacterium woodii]AFA47619.1 2-hydroxyglutaryl-CoA dehydratase alpha subunit HgdC [Acetobacterium woodii DSM 1030]
MITLGIDSGSKTTKAVLYNGEEIIKTAIVSTSANPRKSLSELYQALYSKDVKQTVVTGYGRDLLREGDFQVTEITCHARGSVFLNPDIGGIIDIGGQDSKVILLNSNNRVTDFLMNDKCAAGTGRFIENILRILEIEMTELDDFVDSQQPVQISSMCTVFAESEVIGLLAKDVAPGAIAMGIIHAIAQRTAHFASRLPLGETVFFSGGLANSKVIATILESYLKKPVKTHPLGQYAGAIGAAVIGWEKGNNHE